MASFYFPSPVVGVSINLIVKVSVALFLRSGYNEQTLKQVTALT
jgi:hypothetical protein